MKNNKEGDTWSDPCHLLLARSSDNTAICGYKRQNNTKVIK